MKIKKCPFCGRKIEDRFPHLYEMEEDSWILNHYCNKGLPLTVVIDVYGATKEEVVDYWNERAEASE